MRYFAEMSFKGTRFEGWQVQPGRTTVQGTLEEVFSVFFRHTVSVTGAGRTDTGVHAGYYVAHFETDSLPYASGDLVFKLNRFLPADISLKRIWPVPPGAHARFSALSRTYCYYITRVKDPFHAETSLLYTLPLEVDKMNEAAAILPGCDDFTSFSKLHSDVSNNLCRVTEARWKVKENQLVFTITSDRFLRNMVRAIVGTLLEVGKGKLSVPGFQKITEAKNRCAAGASAPAHGLFLTDIRYPADIFL
jgi:tRNA pseudouridine38-40 synthase